MKKLLTLMLCVLSISYLHSEDEMSTVVFETTAGNIELTLNPKVAPKACENFVKHVQNKYYDGIVFHRVIENFMIQGGDPTGTGMGGESVWGKPFEDEVSDEVKFDKPGLLAMANAGPGTNGSQFFITTIPTDWLHKKHTIFGEVTAGYDKVQKIEKCEKGPGDRPLEEQKIIRAYVKTK